MQLAARVCELAAGKGFLFSDQGDTALRGFEDAQGVALRLPGKRRPSFLQIARACSPFRAPRDLALQRHDVRQVAVIVVVVQPVSHDKLVGNFKPDVIGLN